MQETDWYPMTHCPVYHGVYKTLHLTSNRKRFEGYSKWTSGGWSYTRETAAEAERDYVASNMQSKQWKGVIKEGPK